MSRHRSNECRNYPLPAQSLPPGRATFLGLREPRVSSALRVPCGIFQGCVTVAIVDGTWASDDVDSLVARIELRLEQYKLHPESLQAGSLDARPRCLRTGEAA